MQINCTAEWTDIDRHCKLGDDRTMESGLLTDLYQLNMIEAYLDHEQTKTAVFELFFRKFPPRRGFLMAAGLEQALDFLEQMRFSQGELDWLARSGRFSQRLLDYLATFRFTGDVDAMPEGTVFFAERADPTSDRASAARPCRPRTDRDS